MTHLLSVERIRALELELQTAAESPKTMKPEHEKELTPLKAQFDQSQLELAETKNHLESEELIKLKTQVEQLEEHRNTEKKEIERLREELVESRLEAEKLKQEIGSFPSSLLCIFVAGSNNESLS